MKSLGRLVAIILATAASPAVAQWSFLDFGESNVADYCRTLHGGSSDAIACLDSYRREYDRARNYAYPSDRTAQDIILPALNACRAAHHPEWDRIELCARRQVAPAMRLAAISRSSDAGALRFLAACRSQYPSDLASMENCVSTLQRLRNRP